MSTSKRKGTAWEVAVRDYLDAQGLAVFRNPPAGSRDVGDLTLLELSMVVECKNTRAMDLAGALDEAQTEAVNAGVRYGVAVVKRPRANVSKAYAVMTLEDFSDLILELRP